MENLLFLGVPILKHIRVEPLFYFYIFQICVHVINVQMGRDKYVVLLYSVFKYI